MANLSRTKQRSGDTGTTANDASWLLPLAGIGAVVALGALLFAKQINKKS